MSPSPGGSDCECAAIALAVTRSQPGRRGPAGGHGAGPPARLRRDRGRGKVALVVTEAASNLVKHAGGGELLLRSLERGWRRRPRGPGPGQGPGMADPTAACATASPPRARPAPAWGPSPACPVLRHLLASPAGHGLLARCGARVPTVPPCTASSRHTAGLEVGAVASPSPGSGLRRRLGRGPAARPNTGPGCGRPGPRPPGGRGGAGGRPRLPRAIPAGPGGDRAADSCGPAEHPRGGCRRGRDRPGARELRFAGVGNIAGTIVRRTATSRSMVSHNGTVGHEVRKVQEFIYPFPRAPSWSCTPTAWPPSWRLDAYPGLAGAHPA